MLGKGKWCVVIVSIWRASDTVLALKRKRSFFWCGSKRRVGVLAESWKHFPIESLTFPFSHDKTMNEVPWSDDVNMIPVFRCWVCQSKWGTVQHGWWQRTEGSHCASQKSGEDRCREGQGIFVSKKRNFDHWSIINALCQGGGGGKDGWEAQHSRCGFHGLTTSLPEKMLHSGFKSDKPRWTWSVPQLWRLEQFGAQVLKETCSVA